MAQSLAAFEAGTLSRWMGARLRVDTRVQMYIDRTLQHTQLNVAKRIRMCGQFLLDKTRVNLSRPVMKRANRAGRITVDPASRSKPGEFPRADTTRLMKDVFLVMAEEGMVAQVGTTLDYGLALEVRMNRSFLRRTLEELREKFVLIINGGSE